MALFNKNDGGLMDVIRCDEQDYLIWRWHPQGTDSSASQKAISIRWGSSLRVRDGEVAVFKYSGTPDSPDEYIEGPADRILSTENLPILANIIGLAYDGNSPFQAEVYFINLAGTIKMPFGVPYFDVMDPKLSKLGGMPVAVRGSFNFRISDAHDFVKEHKLAEFNMDDLKDQMRNLVQGVVKSVVSNAPTKGSYPVIEIERRILEITELIQATLKERLGDGTGIEITRVDISDLEINKESEVYKKYMKATNNVATDFVNGAASFLDTISAQANAAKKMKQVRDGEGVEVEKREVGKKVVSAFSSVIGGIKKNSKPTPPPIPTTGFYVAVNGKQKGPYDINKLKSMLEKSEFDKDMLVWKDGMETWVSAGDVEELAPIFGPTAPPIPGE